MSLTPRQHYAASIMQSLIQIPVDLDDHEMLRLAYGLADAMLEYEACNPDPSIQPCSNKD